MKKNIVHICIVVVGALCFNKSFAQSVVFNEVYNNLNYIFNYGSQGYWYNNESIHYFTNSDKSYFLSGHSFTNYAISPDTAKLTLFNLKIDFFGDILWQKTDDLSVSGTEGLGSFYEYSNKELISFGTISDFFYSNYETQDGLIYKMDSLGNESWRRRYHFGEDTHFTSGVFTNDNGQSFQVLGFADVDTGGINYDAFISTIDSSGNLLSNIQLGDSANDFLYGLEYLDNGNYLVCGHTFSQGVGISDIWLLELSPNGTIIWEKTFGNQYYDRIQGSRGMLKYNDNTLYIAGRSGVNSTYLNVSGYLIKTDIQGNKIWEKHFIREDDVDLEFNSIVKNTDGTLIIIGNIFANQTTNERPIGWLLKVDTAGNTIWEREIAKYKDIYADHYVYDGMVSSDGGILIGGYIIANSIVDANGYFHRNDAWLAKTDSCGYTIGDIPEPMLVIDSIQGTTVYLTDQSQNYCTAVLDWGDGSETQNYYAYENNHVLTEKHFSHSYTQTENISIKTTTLAGEEFREYQVQLLTLSSTLASSIEEKNTLSLFPNPANNYVVVQNSNTAKMLNQVQHDELSMRISNLNGKQVKSYNLSTKLYQQKIDISSLNNGVYIVQFELDGVLLETEKLVVAK